MDAAFLSPPPSLDSFIGRINPTILLIIVILGSIFAISGLLHLLIRYLLRKSNREQDYLDSATALQGQLQQLFHLHDAGVDQSFIDTLPVFLYKDVAKDLFDCAVCLCEFHSDEKLRLLPECSHAFHVDCIDTWLLSHSTCPLCRTSLLRRRNFSPFVFLLESNGESSRENGQEDTAASSSRNITRSGEMAVQSSSTLVAVKLGKLKSSEASGSGSRAIDERRCFSMGSFQYVTEEASLVKVNLKPAISRRHGESFSVSKIWLRSKKEKCPEASYDEEIAGDVITKAEETPSFARRTLQWISGWNQKTGSHRHSQSCAFSVDGEIADGDVRKENP